MENLSSGATHGFQRVLFYPWKSGGFVDVLGLLGREQT